MNVQVRHVQGRDVQGRDVQGRHVVIVGGGVIGVACAHYLQTVGFRVTVIEKGVIGGECSHGNCGLVCPSHVLPLAEPGAIGSTVKAMLKPGAAFRIRPRFDLALWKWLLNFARRCNRQDMLQSGRAIQPLLSSSLQLYTELVAHEGLECEWQKEGLLFVYRNLKPLEQYEPVNALLSSEFNESASRISGHDLRAFEPALQDGLAGAWYFEHDAHLRPDRLLASWRSLLEQRDVRFIEHCELQKLQHAEGLVTSVIAAGQQIDADAFVVATGAWTPRLADILGCRIPIEPGKGYSLTLPRPENCPRVPMIFPEHRVAVTPLQTGLRVGSIMEFAGYDTRIGADKLKMLTDGASCYLKDPLPHPIEEKWFGWRPMTYDSTPVIGHCPGFSNVFLATGHNMLGLSMAPATGRLVSELMTGVETHISAEPYRAERFVEGHASR